MRRSCLIVALLLLAAPSDAQRSAAGGGPRNTIGIGDGSLGDRGERRVLRGDVWLIENDVVEVVEKPAAPAAVAAPPAEAPPAAPAEKREPYKLGNVYDSLPGGCMKMIQGGASYYLCDGEWYQQVAGGGYKAVKAP